mgnify:CR=1 FL=1
MKDYIPTIVIVIEGGNVKTIVSNDAEIKIKVIDHDNLKAEQEQDEKINPVTDEHIDYATDAVLYGPTLNRFIEKELESYNK